MLGRVISGKFGEICIRQKSDQNIQLGELLIAGNKDVKILLQVYDLIYGSQISSKNLELISGLSLEEGEDLKFMDPELRNYKLAMLKNLITISKQKVQSSKILPDFFSNVREIRKEDVDFLTLPKNPLFVGNLRSGSKVLEVPINLPGADALAHHILIPATTGKGKSNMLFVLLWDAMDKDYCGFLVLDPHDEYYGRHNVSLKDHPSKNIVYYTPKNVPPGGITLKINLKCLLPSHFDGALSLTDAQSDAVSAYCKQYKENWIEAAVLEQPLTHKFIDATLSVVKRKLCSILNLRIIDEKIVCRGIFDKEVGVNTIKDIINELEKAKTVIIDTSSFSGSVEILVGSIISSGLFERYKYYGTQGSLLEKPVISVVLEEAPRVLGKDAMAQGPNIFSTIAREGRKFKIGLIAITQLPSLIPRTILANMNTKIILGLEMAPERQSIIESASQDLSTDSRSIASLDKGEAIISSNFVPFAIPIKIPLFPGDVVKSGEEGKGIKIKKDFSGINLGE